MGRRRAAKDPAVRVELTPRHEEVLRLMAAGKTNGEIAEVLGLTFALMAAVALLGVLVCLRLPSTVAAAPPVGGVRAREAVAAR